jgi:hypothetical protein
MPRVLAFYRDVIDDGGSVIGWRTIAWGLAFGDGSAVSIPIGRPVSVTLWPSLEDAATALDAHIDTPILGTRSTIWSRALRRLRCRWMTPSGDR